IPDQVPATAYEPFFHDSQWTPHSPPTVRVERPEHLCRYKKSISASKQAQGDLSIATREIPPDLEDPLVAEVKEKEGKDEERGATFSGESRSDGRISRHQCFEGGNDVDQD
ncbi:hypothetical protein BKA82DRAFT_3929952, partial [Pisolithus tinctorius]